jgi:hypothetical protein
MHAYLCTARRLPSFHHTTEATKDTKIEKKFIKEWAASIFLFVCYVTQRVARKEEAVPKNLLVMLYLKA